MSRRFSRSETSVMMALLHVYLRDGRATVRSVAKAAGRSTMGCHDHLVRLRDEGLCTWEEKRAGTLRPTVTIVRPVPPYRWKP